MSGVKTGFFPFVRHGIARGQPDIVAGRRMVNIRHADGKCPFFQNILRGLVSRTDAKRQLAVVADPAPRRVPGVRAAAFIIGRQNKNRLRVGLGLCSEIFAHTVDLLFGSLIFGRRQMSCRRCCYQYTQPARWESRGN